MAVIALDLKKGMGSSMKYMTCLNFRKKLFFNKDLVSENLEMQVHLCYGNIPNSA
jgi:hypothetical protein